MTDLTGKVAFITGAARGQGRSHALRLAEHGADIVALDICGTVESNVAPGTTSQDLEHTRKLVESTGRSIVTVEGDVRNKEDLDSAVGQGIRAFGHIDVVVANAGIASVGALWEISSAAWQEMIDVNLTGVWNTVKAAVPSMIERGKGGSLILTSSAAGICAVPRIGHYTAAKHGVTGLAKAFAVELAPYGIRCNSLHPGNTNTPMIANPGVFEAFTGNPDISFEDYKSAMASNNALNTPWAEVEDISSAVLYLASDDSRFATGTQLVVDAGNTLAFTIPH